MRASRQGNAFDSHQLQTNVGQTGFVSCTWNSPHLALSSLVPLYKVSNMVRGDHSGACMG